MDLKIVIVGATGILGNKLIKYCYNNSIQIAAITYFNNKQKSKYLKKRYNIKNCFCLKDLIEKKLFIKYISTTSINIIYFLDYGSESLKYSYFFLKNNSNSIIAIANKEMLIAGGKFFIQYIKKTKNILIPLDSEHFSLLNSITNTDYISKVYITASGGPFYFNKKVNLNFVNFDDVINHPKWKMGINNSIDSSNFINKILEMYELSIIYDIDIKKISFLISKNAFIHSVIKYKDGTISLNGFKNEMLITLIKPLRHFYKLNEFKTDDKRILDISNYQFTKFNDKRFKISKYLKILKNLSHCQMINFIILNNIAHKNYINNTIKYNDIVPFIMNRLNDEKISFSNFNNILKYISFTKHKYENNL
jgi:1-deoxy-D-xylulose-5-phosphate reductoisomerase